MGQFKKGLFIGGLLGIAMTWLNTTKKGKVMRDDLIDQAAKIYGDVKEKIMASDAWQTMNENKYVMMAQEAIDKYAVETGLTDRAKKLLTRLVTMQWSTLESEVKKSRKRSP